MPCNSDYLAPNVREQELQRAAKLLVWVKTKLHKVVPDYAKKAAADIYGNGGDRALKELCSTLKQMNKNKCEGLIYGNARDPIARDLADWWETHQAADAAREQREAEEHDSMREEKRTYRHASQEQESSRSENQKDWRPYQTPCQ